MSYVDNKQNRNIVVRCKDNDEVLDSKSFEITNDKQYDKVVEEAKKLAKKSRTVCSEQGVLA